MKQFLAKLLVINLLIPTLLAADQAVDATFSQATSYTDEQMNEAQNFIHQGKKNEAYEKGCATIDNCETSAVSNDGVLLKGELGSMLEQHLGKLYAALFGGAGLLMGGGGGPTVNKVTQQGSASVNLNKEQSKALAKNGEVTDAAGNKVEQTTDYCMYIAISYEFLAGLMQGFLQEQSNNTVPNDLQLQALVNLKETHEARQKTATYQAGAYGATSVCYLSTMAGKVVDKMYIAKMTAAAGLATLYAIKAKNHGDAADNVQKVINSLPKAGDCNPWTGTSCFCSHPTSQTLYPSQYNEVCVLNNGDFNGNRATLPCGVLVNNKMELDKACKCKQTNSCFMANLKTFDPKFNVSSNLVNQANKGFSLLGSDFDKAKLDAFIAESTALTKSVAAKTKLKKVPNVTLNDQQKKDAEALKEIIPQPYANMVAALPPRDAPGGGIMSNVTASALSKLPKETKKKIAEIAAIKVNKKTNSASTKTEDEEQLVLPTMGGQKEAKTGTEVVSFAEKAISQADVSNRPDTPIFDIISNRYRHSMQKLDSEKK